LRTVALGIMGRGYRCLQTTEHSVAESNDLLARHGSARVKAETPRTMIIRTDTAINLSASGATSAMRKRGHDPADAAHPARPTLPHQPHP
jgi:hypothetical protein